MLFSKVCTLHEGFPELKKETCPVLREYRLEDDEKEPPDLRSLLENSLEIQNRETSDCLFWVSKDSFFRHPSRDPDFPCHVGPFEEGHFTIIFLTDDQKEDSSRYEIAIHAFTVQESILAIEFLLTLQDKHFESFTLTGQFELEVPICPLRPHNLKRILQVPNRSQRFSSTLFTPEQCHILATCGTGSKLDFVNCFFQDCGSAFVEALGSRPSGSGPLKLGLCAHSPFSRENWISLLQANTGIRYLELACLQLDKEASIVLASARHLEKLEFTASSLQDKGDALIAAMAQGQSPQGLAFHDGQIFRTLARWRAFMEAFQTNTHLKRLEITFLWRLSEDRESQQNFADVLRKNSGLEELTLRELPANCWSALLNSIEHHPTLRFLDFQHSGYVQPFSRAEKEARTLAVASVLHRNQQLEEIRFDQRGYDEATWTQHVIPRLECNLYRKRLACLNFSANVSLFGVALSTVCNKPALVWMLFHANQSLVVSHVLDDGAVIID